MELSTAQETTSCAAAQELPGILWNQKVHYRIHKSPQLVPILSSHPISPRSILILSADLCHGFPSCLFPFWLSH
jgi:hypothetical protein